MQIATFGLATAERTKGQGNWPGQNGMAQYCRFMRTAEIVRDYVKKGTQLFIEGRSTNRSWDDKQTGEKKYRTEILVNELTLLGKPGGSGEGGGSYSKSNTAPYTATAAAPPPRPTSLTRASPTTTSPSSLRVKQRNLGPHPIAFSRDGLGSHGRAPTLH